MSSTSAFAREQEDKKGMDPAQVTGAASSYARKYALN
ncbi:MAG: ERF family protein [Methanobrevibacter sp.]|nr:ERF family protein [Methanobrevibacter sp.]